MDYSISHEVFILFCSVLSGIIISIIYDLFRLIRKNSESGFILICIQDILFWFIATFIMFYTVFDTNNGKLRWYHFLGGICGAILYFSCLSRPVIYLLHRFIRIFFKFFELFFKILLTPLKFMYNILYVCLCFIISPVVCLVRMSGRKIRYLIHNTAFRLRKVLTKK